MWSISFLCPRPPPGAATRPLRSLAFSIATRFLCGALVWARRALKRPSGAVG
jgi:hypothetical protein